MTLTKKDIDDHVKILDDARPDKAAARTTGIAVKRREFISEQERIFLYGSNNPEMDGDEQCISPLEIIENIDDWAARQQHLICGRPPTEPVRTIDWLRDHYTGPVGKMNYPHGIISERAKEAEDKWTINSISSYKHSRNLVRIPPDQGKKRVRETSDI
jgi:hypothetical protein